jgi:hypothetical protein
MPTLSGRITKRRLIRAGLIVVVPLIVEKLFELFISEEGLESGRRLQGALINALGQYNFVGFIGRFFVNFAAVPGAVGTFLSQIFGHGLLTNLLLFPTIPISWAFAFLWTPFDLVLHGGFHTLVIAVLQVAAAWIILERWPKMMDAQRTPSSFLREQGDYMDRIANWLIVYLLLMIFSTLLGAWLYAIVGGGTLLLGWALDLAGLFLFANTVAAFCYLWVMKYAEEQISDFAKEQVDRMFGDEDGDGH